MSIFKKIGKGISKIAGKGGIIDKATRAVDKATGGISGKVFKTVEGVVKSVPVVGTAYTAVKGVGGAMIKVADGTASKINAAKVDVSKELSNANSAKTIIVQPSTTQQPESFFKKMYNQLIDFFAKYPWVKWVLIISLPLGLLLFFFRKKRRVTRRRKSISRKTSIRKRKSVQRGISKTAMQRKMSRVRAARKNKRKR